MKSVQDWRGDSIPVRCFEDAVDIACLIGGVNPAADRPGFFSEAHYQHLAAQHPDLVAHGRGQAIIFVDCITDLTRQAMAWAKTRPEAFSEKTGKPDTRGAYGLLAREVIGLLKHLQHAPGKTVIFVGILEKRHRRVRPRHLAAADGGRQGRARTARHRRPGDHAGAVRPRWRGLAPRPRARDERRLVCRAGNSFGLPAKDRSGRLDVTEPPDLAALLTKINATTHHASASHADETSFDMNDAEPPRGSDLIPDGTFAKVTMAHPPGRRRRPGRGSTAGCSRRPRPPRQRRA